MNGLFNQALSDARIDYLVVRRVEYLMGLVDGLIGVHDSRGGPFYISDLLMTRIDEETTSPATGPAPSPWVPGEVLALQDISQWGRRPSDRRLAPQVQWQIAEFSRARLLPMVGLSSLQFQPEALFDAHSPSADSTTGYMNFHLGKPGMTLEGRRGREYGQYLAQATYTLLLGFGHQIDSSFETTLANPNPTVEPEIYVGLEPMDTETLP